MEGKRLDDQARLRQLAGRVALAEAAERRRIAAGLHDQVGQLLASAKLRLGAWLAAAPGEVGTEPLEAIGDLLDRAIWATRALTFELSSPVLYELGLEEALRSLGEQIEQTHGLRVRIHAETEPAPLTDDLRDLLFRGARELLMNVVKHARAQQVDLRVERAGPNLRLSVCDDGVGLDPNEAGTGVSAGGGIGLFSLATQLTHVGGRLKIDAAPGAGTRVVATAPLAGVADVRPILQAIGGEP